MARRRALGPPPGTPTPATDSVFRLKVALEYLVPQIWRRVEVPDCTLDKLHEVIQRVMPWESSHLWCFDVGKTRYIDPEFMDFPEDRPAQESTIGRLHAAGVKKLKYEYDFGDGWVHRVTIERTVPRQTGVKYPRCTAGARACPPEDCGGFPGYEYLLYLLEHPKHKDYKERMEWLGGPFDPEAFDPGEVNKDLQRLRL
jgi:hypothetical protein